VLPLDGAAPSFAPGPRSRRQTLDEDRIDFSALIGEYRDEARHQLDVLDACLLELEQAGALSDARAAELQRTLHTLKGNSGMMGFGAIRDAVHALEGVFRAPPQAWTAAELDPLFLAAAALREAVERAGTDAGSASFARLAAATPTLPGASAPAPPVPSGPPATAPANVAAPPGADELLRVPLAKLDTLLNQVGELVQAADSLGALLRGSQGALARVGLYRPLLDEVERLTPATDTLTGGVMELRLVPVRRVFSRFPSMVREMARAASKQARVVLEGEDTELDKSTIDALGEPLVHLVRNAVDHGIGTPEQRAAIGKQAEGTITLRARQQGDLVFIEVEDDGRGLDQEAIAARAREIGLLAPDAPEPPAEEVGELIFRPGFSTRREASPTSGRGIGLDVVRASVTRLRGALDVEDVPGRGTRFILRLPLTVAIVPAVVFEAGGALLALPATDVEETVRRPERDRVGAAEVIRYHDEIVPVARAEALFGWREAAGVVAGEPEAASAARLPFALVIRQGTRAVAVAADRLVDQRDVVVKPLPAGLGARPGVSGASVAPDQRVILLLDAGGVIDLNLDHYRRHARDGSAE
jgi:two-component system chemotaxis sensor kinase CheA